MEDETEMLRALIKELKRDNDALAEKIKTLREVVKEQNLKDYDGAEGDYCDHSGAALE